MTLASHGVDGKGPMLGTKRKFDVKLGISTKLYPTVTGKEKSSIEIFRLDDASCKKKFVDVNGSSSVDWSLQSRSDPTLRPLLKFGFEPP